MRAVAPVLRALVVAVALFVVSDLVFVRTFPHFDRLRYNFSAAYLIREARSLRDARPVIVLGDSVLWGFGVLESQTAASLLRARNPRWHNLAYAGGSPVNTLAMLQFLLHSGVSPGAVVFNVNQKEFNLEDSAYQRLHPAVEEVAWAELTPRERAAILTVLSMTNDSRLDRSLSRVWNFYGMRPDVRDALFGDTDAAHRALELVQRASGSLAETEAAHRPTADTFEGTYDLAPIAADNVSYRALREIGSLLRTRGIPALAVLTPTNHRLLHDYIDVPRYRQNLMTVTEAMRDDGIRVLDLDGSFPASDFIDNDHLTPLGNIKLARLLERALHT